MLSATSISFFLVADVKCGLYEINKSNRANATHRLSPVQRMFRHRSKQCWTGEVQDQDLDPHGQYWAGRTLPPNNLPPNMAANDLC